MKKLRRISKHYYLRQIVSCWLVFYMLFCFGMPAQIAMAVENPAAGALPGGVLPGDMIDSIGVNAAVIAGPDMTIQQTASEAIINWQNFDIGEDASVTFGQTASMAVLNRVHDGDVTGIMGTLAGDGRVFVINPAGIVFGEGAVVNVSQLVASSLKLDDADFLNGAPYQFYDGAAAGEVRNESPDTLTAERIYLIGKHVINTGSLRAENGYVVMAAGDTVTITESGSSVAVEITMPLVDTGEYLVDHYGDGKINAQHVILAAGDIWSSAYIEASVDGSASVTMDAKGDIDIDGEVYAYAGPGSDAVATVDIDAGGDIEIDNSIYAEADNDSGNPEDDAVATIDIDAGGRIDILSSTTEARADTRDGSGNATATVDIDADGDVDIDADYFKARAEAVDSGNATANTRITGENVEADNWVVARAITDNSGDAESNIEITARGDLIVDGIKSKVSSVQSGDATSDIKISGVNIDAGWILSRAQGGFIYGGNSGNYDDYSGNSGNATAGIDIAATGTVDVDNRVQSYAEAQNNSGSADATTKIVGTEINIEDGDNDISVGAKAETYDYSGNATADVVIEATTGDVIINSDEYPVMAEASVENPDTEYTGDSDAGVTITAAGDVEIWDLVKAEADAEDGAGDATATVDITADGSVTIHENDDDDWDYIVQADVWVYEDSGSGEATLNITALGGDADIYDDVKSEAETSENSGNATATLDISASGDVGIYENEGDTVIAVAEVENPDDEYEGDATATLGITAGGDMDIYDLVKAEADAEDGAGDATTTVDITAGGTVTIHEPVNGEDYMVQSDVWVTNNSGSGDATVNITALGGDVEIYDDIKAEAETSENSGNATATLDISASGDVIIAENEGDTVKARASVDNPDTEYEGDATATLSITADGDVDIYDDVEAEAETDGDAGDADATVTVDAGGDLTIGEDGEIYVYAYAQNNSGDATADVDIDAGNVTVDGSGDIYAEARTDEYSGDASATVDVDATGDVTVDEHGYLYADADAQNYSGNATALVDIDTGGNVGVYGNGYLYAEVETDEDSGDATATVDIDAGGDVDVVGGDEGEGHIYAEADAQNYSGNATALVDIDASNVTVNDGEMFADAEATDGSGDAAATVDIATTSSEVIVEDDSEIYAYAYTYDDSGDATAETTVTADNVTVRNNSEIYAEAYAYSGSGDAAATVDIDATGDVLVEGGVESSSYLWSYAYTDDSGDATAETTVTADNVTVTDDSEIYADAYAEDHSGDAAATVDIDVGSDLTVEDNGKIQAYAYTEDGSGDATAEVDIDAGGNVNISDEGTGSNMCDTIEAWAEALRGSSEYDPSGSALANTSIDAGGSIDIDNAGVKAFADAKGTVTGTSESNVHIYTLAGGGDITIGVDSKVHAKAMTTFCETADLPGGATLASTSVDIQSCEDVIVNGMVKSHARTSISGEPYNPMGNTVADIFVKAFGDVIVNSTLVDEDPEGYIMAHAHGGYENNTGVIVEAVHNVIVNDSSETTSCLREGAEIFAHSNNGHTNNAFIGIATRDMIAGILDGSGDIIVNGQIKALAHSCTSDEPGGPVSYNADVQISAARDVIVNGGYALYGEGDSFDLIESHEGGLILAEASNVDNGGEGVSALENTANVDVYAGRDVIVHGAEVELTEEPFEADGDGSYDGGLIKALAGYEGDSGFEQTNTASVGVYAQRDITINAATVDELLKNGLDLGGQILAAAHADNSWLSAIIDICASRDVVVDGEVRAVAGTSSGGLNEAHIVIAAGGEIAGSGGIFAEAEDGAQNINTIIFRLVDEDRDNFDGDLSQEPEYEDYEDCPDCDFEWIDWDWCVDCEEGFFAPAAPLAQFQIPTIEGCPHLVQAAAVELGITAETIQVGIGNALALNPTIQACEACAALVNAAGILRDEDGSRMAAMVQMFNALAPADAPFTPGTAASIAMAFEGAAEGTQYASAMEYVDAFVQYVAVLDIELGSPVGDSVAFVMDKYGAGITDSDNVNIGAFVATRLEAIGE